MLDGYPMSRNGEARKAPDIALYASCFADFVSNLSLILLAGLLASFALRFGPPEYFTLVVFSLTIIAGIAGNHMAKGMISAGLGLLLATIGLDLVYGTSRLVFGEVDLMAVLNFIPVLIGLFALPEIIDYYARRTGLLGQVQALAGDPATFAEFRRCFKSILRGSVIGAVLGAIRVFSRIVLLPNRLLLPIVLVLCVYGGYAGNNNLFDILVMMLIGLLGFGLLRASIPAAPFLIVFVPGPLLEDNFRQSLLLSHGSLDIFVRNEICWIFWCLTAIAVVLIIRRQHQAPGAE